VVTPSSQPDISNNTISEPSTNSASDANNTMEQPIEEVLNTTSTDTNNSQAPISVNPTIPSEITPDNITTQVLTKIEPTPIVG